MPKEYFTVSPEAAGLRLDRFLCEKLPDFSRTDIQKWIDQGNVVVRGLPAAKNLRMTAGLILEVAERPRKASTMLESEPMELDIRWEDEHLAVLFKPRGLVVHPGNGNATGTLAAGLLHHYRTLSTVNGVSRPGIVHRLDKDTAGLMIIAKNDVTHAKLSRMLEERHIERIYRALVWGATPACGTVDAAIARDRRERVRMAINPAGKPARTHYRVLEWFRFATLVELKLESGRTHQIRVHMRHLGHPVVGDTTYGGTECNLQRIGPLDRPAAAGLLKLCSSQILQAVRLRFEHPHSGNLLEFSTPEEADFTRTLTHLQREARHPGDQGIPHPLPDFPALGKDFGSESKEDLALDADEEDLELL